MKAVSDSWIGQIPQKEDTGVSGGDRGEDVPRRSLSPRIMSGFRA